MSRISCAAFESTPTLKARAAIYIVVHINHPNELTDNVKAALARLADAGIPLLSQTVLLKGVNNSVEVLAKLMRPSSDHGTA